MDHPRAVGPSHIFVEGPSDGAGLLSLTLTPCPCIIGIYATGLGL